VAVLSVSTGTFRVEVATGAHRLVADEVERLGGTDQGPDPFDLLAASLGACTAIAVADAARARALPISRVEVRVSTKFNKVAARPGDEQLALVELRRSIHIEADVSPDDLAWLYARGTDCPVSRALGEGVAIRTTTGALTGRREC
jgi:uncharacterized OsmC-like protein